MYCVYQLQNDRGQVYFGITKDPKERFWKHRTFKYNNCTSVILWENGGVVDDIEPLYWFETEQLALEREKELIRNNICVNIAGKYTRQEQMKRFREQNMEKLNAHNREKIKCDICSSIVSRSNLTAHQKTKKCKTHAVGKLEKIKCAVCGSMISRPNIAKHQRTNKCKSSVNSCD
jgi:predicted GIY-YIG superfamily endonuclease/ribosomal protein S27E